MLHDLSLESSVWSQVVCVGKKSAKSYWNMLKLQLVALIMLSICILANAAPYQELPPRKGHVPVYIRHGEEPLTEIHPGLAEAFNEQQLQSQNLITEKSLHGADETTLKTITESDIASFEAIKAKAE